MNTIARVLTLTLTVVIPIMIFGYSLAERERIDRFCQRETPEGSFVTALVWGLAWPLYVSYNTFDKSTDEEKCV
jgi:hypothetical protein